MTTASNHIFKECIDQFVTLNDAELALGVMVDTSLEKNIINAGSQVFINTIQLPENEVIKLTCHLERTFLNQPYSNELQFFNQHSSQHNSNVLNNKYLKNIRYIPIEEEGTVLAIILLINISLPINTHQLPDVAPLILTLFNLLKGQQHIDVAVVKAPSSEIKPSDEKLAESLLQNTFHPTFIFNEAFNVLKANAASQKLFNSNIDRGWPTIDKLIEKSMPSVASQIFTTINKYGFLGHLNKEQWCNVDFEHNSYQSVKVDVQLFQIEYLGSSCFGLMLNENIHEKVTSEDYFSSLQRFNALTSVVPMAILQVDKDWKCSYVNETWSRYTGQNISDAKVRGWLSCLHMNDIQDILPTIQRVTSYSKNYKGEIQLKKIDESGLWVSVNAIGLFNDKYELTGFILTINDISESYQHAEKLEKMANYDHLTGLSNRSFFNDRLSVALSRSKRHGITALMFLDLDKFKNINDTLGHPVGDKVIQEVASRLALTVRDEDSIARLGGDEFAIIFTDIQTIHILASIAQKIVNAIHLPFEVNGHPITMSCSIGISMTDDDSIIHTPTEMLNKADLALYKAKDSGRNQFYFYDSQLELNISLLNRLRESLNNPLKNELSLVFQPQINALSTEIIGFEALSRWNNDVLGYIGPDVFIKAIEDNNLIHEFSSWLFNEVIEIVSQWIKKDLIKAPQRIAVNVSAKQLHYSGFADSIINLFNTNNISPEWFTLEVTETAFIEDPTIAGHNLQKLKTAGFLIALDDFGTGYSSLSLLRKMPLNYIKIDRSFVQDILQDEDAAIIVEATISLSHMLHLDVVAEGVENKEVQDWLINHNCLIHQGYFFSKPLSKNNTESLLLTKALPTTNRISRLVN